MIPLTAREALSPQVERVTATMRPSELEERKRGSGLCGVFGEEDEAFLGLVAEHASARFPNRIFADLLAEPGPAPVAAETPIETVFHRMAAEGVEAIPVLDENRAFLGVITWPSLLETLLRRERELLAEAQRLQDQLEAEQKHLVTWSKRQEELNEASRALLGLVGQTTLERELLQQATQALATIVQARYGAIGILDEASGLQQFHFAGLTPKEVDRIGEHPRGRGLLGVIIREDQILRLEDLTQDSRHAGFPPYHPPMKTLLAVPISHQGAVYGRVYLCDKTTGEPFTEDDERLTVGFARSLALALAHSLELAERTRAEEEVKTRADQQAAVAELGQRALSGADLSTLINEAVASVAQTLEVEYCKVLELLPDGNGLLLRAGVGWKEGYVGHATVGAETDSQAGYTLLSNEPVIVEDLRTETRFSGPPLLHDHGVVSGMSVIIWGLNRPFGVLGAHTSRRQTFTQDDIHFLQAVANMLAAAVQRVWAEEALRESEDRYRDLVEHSHDLICTHDLEGNILSVNQQAGTVLGCDPSELLMKNVRDFLAPEVRDEFDAYLARIRSDGAASGLMQVQTRLGERRVWEYNNTLRTEGVAAPIVRGVARDVTERKRAEETLHALYQAGLVVQEPMGLEDRLTRLFQTARDVLHLDRLSILLADPEGRWLEGVAALGTKTPPEAMRVPIGPEGGGLAHAYLSQQPVIWADSQAPVPETIRLQHPYNRLEAFRSRAFALLPMVVQGRAIGVMGADRKHTRRPLEPALLPLLQLFAGQAAIAIENSRLFEQVQDGRERLRTLSHQLVEIQEAERQHIARELHDEIGQALTGLKLSLEMSKHVPPDAIRPRLDEALALVNELMAHARDLSLDLRPAMLDDLGLLPTLLWHFDRYAAQTGIQVTFKHTGLERRFAPQIETAAYRIVQEALTNVARHAGVSEVMVQLWADQDKLEARIEDHGAGFDPRAALATSATSGLVGMRERAASLGGQLTVESSPGIGVRLTAEFPLGASVERRGRERVA